MQSARDFLEEISSSSVLIPNYDDLIPKLEALRTAFPSDMLIIGDFDRTITRTEFEGRECLTTHNYLRELISNPDKRQLIANLQRQYLPVEFDPNITETDKHFQMITWWEGVHSIICSAKIKKSEIPSQMDAGHLIMRDNFEQFAEIMYDFEIPFVVFSAGVGDVVSAFLSHFKILYSNMKIVSNKMIYDEDGYVCGFHKPLINTFNKNTTQLKRIVSKKTWESYLPRQYVLLFGDSPGDVTMCNGFPYEHLIKIGFVNNPTEELIRQYKSIYDILIISDQTFDIILKVLYFIMER